MNRIFGKLAYSLFTIFLALTAIFFIIRLTPGDPVSRILGPEASQKEVLLYRKDLGLDQPISIQYLSYMKNLFLGDFGVSLFKKKNVGNLILSHIGPTLTLSTIAMLISAVLGVFLGIWSGHRKSSWVDNLSRVVSLFFLSFPIFSLAPLLVLIFSIQLGVLPVSEWLGVEHTILPILTLVFPLTSVLVRVTRNKFLEEVNVPWVTVLRAKGMGEFAILLRLTKVCLPSIFNVIAIQLSVILAGTMITETIFDIPGMGMLLLSSIENRDYPIVQGVIIYSTVIYMAVYFLVDFFNEKVDPRIRVN